MKLFDLSHPIFNEMPSFDLKVKLTKIKSLEKDLCNAYYLAAGLHIGTHIDSPMHLTASKKKLMNMIWADFVAEHAY